MITRAKNGIFKPKHFVATTHSLPSLSASSSALPSLPASTSAALVSPAWKSAMRDEFQALLDNQTWDLVPYTDDMKVITNKWVFKVKTLADGSLDKLKARLVARGF